MSKNKMSPGSENDFRNGLQNEWDVREFFIKSKEGRELAAKLIEEYEKLVEMYKASMEEAIRHEQMERIIVKLSEKEPDVHVSHEPSFYEKMLDQQHKIKAAAPTIPTKTPEFNAYESIVKDNTETLAAISERHQIADEEHKATLALLDDADKLMLENSDDTPETREEKIAALREQIAQSRRDLEARLDESTTMLDRGFSDEEAMAETRKINAEMAVLQHRENYLDFKEGKKILFDKNGEPCDNFKEASFIVDKDKKIVVEDNKTYLLNKDETLSDENRARAEKDFNNQRIEIMSVRDLAETSKNTQHTILGQMFMQTMEQMEKKIDELPDISKPEMSAAADTSYDPLAIMKPEQLELAAPMSSPSDTTASPDIEYAQEETRGINAK